MESMLRESFLGEDAVLLAKSQYFSTGSIRNRSTVLKSTTFGVRNAASAQWSYHYLSYGQEAFFTRFDHYGCFDLA